MVSKESRRKKSPLVKVFDYITNIMAIIVILASLALIGLLIFSKAVTTFSEEIIIPAYMSTLAGCGLRYPTEGISESIEYSKVGSYNTETQEINIEYSPKENPKEYRATMRHELTHKLQDDWGMLADCKNNRRGVFLNEVYAKISEHIPFWEYVAR